MNKNTNKYLQTAFNFPFHRWKIRFWISAFVDLETGKLMKFRSLVKTLRFMDFCGGFDVGRTSDSTFYKTWDLIFTKLSILSIFFL